MSLRAELDRQKTRRSNPGVTPGQASRVFALVVPLLVLLLSASSSSAQRSASSAALVQIPTVSQLHVEPVSTILASTSDDRTGLVRVRVRANHGWKVVVAVPAGLGGSVWVRALGDGVDGSYRRLEPGAEAVLATGAGGETEVRVEYRWEGAVDSDPDVSSDSLIYTLAAL